MLISRQIPFLDITINEGISLQSGEVCSHLFFLRSYALVRFQFPVFRQFSSSVRIIPALLQKGLPFPSLVDCREPDCFHGMCPSVNKFFLHP